ncbi:MAG: undecaprenyldiphospho-muramoylpentapeptide beta-N-acetylglucosaminyltransferase [Bacteroides sp.]
MLHRVVIAGGGTGGHIFPALAIGKELLRETPELELLYVGALGRMEMEKVPAAGFKIVGLPIEGVPRRKTPWSLFRFFCKWQQSRKLARKLLKEYNPDVVVGVGGYASVPAMQEAQKLGIPTFIQEQNSYAGKANRMLGRRAERIAVAYEGMDRYFPREKVVLTGNPVRSELLHTLPPREESVRALGLPAGCVNVLVMGGSLGARKLSEAILEYAASIGAREDIAILLQTGRGDFEQIRDRVQQLGVKNIYPVAFITEMEKAYSAADLIVSRAGAIAISELAIIGKPVILVPSPYVAEDHQTKNARVLSEQGAAILIPEREASASLWSEIARLLADKTCWERMHNALCALARPDAVKEICEYIRQLKQK